MHSAVVLAICTTLGVSWPALGPTFAVKRDAHHPPSSFAAPPRLSPREAQFIRIALAVSRARALADGSESPSICDGGACRAPRAPQARAWGRVLAAYPFNAAAAASPDALRMAASAHFASERTAARRTAFSLAAAATAAEQRRNVARTRAARRALGDEKAKEQLKHRPPLPPVDAKAVADAQTGNDAVEPFKSVDEVRTQQHVNDAPRSWAVALWDYEPRAPFEAEEMRLAKGMRYIYRGIDATHVRWAIVERLPGEVGIVPLAYLALLDDEGDATSHHQIVSATSRSPSDPLERALRAAASVAAAFEVDTDASDGVDAVRDRACISASSKVGFETTGTGAELAFATVTRAGAAFTRGTFAVSGFALDSATRFEVRSAANEVKCADATQVRGLALVVGDTVAWSRSRASLLALASDAGGDVAGSDAAPPFALCACGGELGGPWRAVSAAVSEDDASAAQREHSTCATFDLSTCPRGTWGDDRTLRCLRCPAGTWGIFEAQWTERAACGFTCADVGAAAREGYTGATSQAEACVTASPAAGSDVAAEATAGNAAVAKLALKREYAATVAAARADAALRALLHREVPRHAVARPRFWRSAYAHGVTRRRSSTELGAWEARFTIPRTAHNNASGSIYLGALPSEAAAARAHDIVALAFEAIAAPDAGAGSGSVGGGRRARLNFPATRNETHALLAAIDPLLASRVPADVAAVATPAAAAAAGGGVAAGKDAAAGAVGGSSSGGASLAAVEAALAWDRERARLAALQAEANAVVEAKTLRAVIEDGVLGVVHSQNWQVRRLRKLHSRLIALRAKQRAEKLSEIALAALHDDEGAVVAAEAAGAEGSADATATETETETAAVEVATAAVEAEVAALFRGEGADHNSGRACVSDLDINRMNSSQINAFLRRWAVVSIADVVVAGKPYRHVYEIAQHVRADLVDASPNTVFLAETLKFGVAFEDICVGSIIVVDDGDDDKHAGDADDGERYVVESDDSCGEGDGDGSGSPWEAEVNVNAQLAADRARAAAAASDDAGELTLEAEFGVEVEAEGAARAATSLADGVRLAYREAAASFATDAAAIEVVIEEVDLVEEVESELDAIARRRFEAQQGMGPRGAAVGSDGGSDGAGSVAAAKSAARASASASAGGSAGAGAGAGAVAGAGAGAGAGATEETQEDDDDIDDDNDVPGGVDDNVRCEEWAVAGECTVNPTWMLEFCAVACRRCAEGAKREGEGNGLTCVDPHSEAKRAAATEAMEVAAAAVVKHEEQLELAVGLAAAYAEVAPVPCSNEGPPPVPPRGA